MSIHPKTGANFHYVEHVSPGLSPGDKWSYFHIRDATSFGTGVIVRFWAPVVLFAILTAVPLLPLPRWRFRLRTMLIVTTLIAVVLGFIAWLMR
jgi:hypothetical protein